MHHYLFRNIPFEFVVPFKNSWDVHPFNFVNPMRTFVVLAESEKGSFNYPYTSLAAMILEASDNLIGTQFNLDRKYPETIAILRNFIEHQLGIDHQFIINSQNLLFENELYTD